MDYAQARLQSRFGARPSEALWERLESAATPAAALALAESSSLRHWVAGLAADADSHAIEIALRVRWRECIAEVASWMPPRWQEALRWVGQLADLPAVAYLARGGAPLDWMFNDPALQGYACADAEARPILLRAGRTPAASERRSLPSTMSGDSEPARLRQAWLEAWRRRWPRWGDTGALDDLARLLEAAMAQPATPARGALQTTLRRLFRRSLLTPAAAFIYLACTAIDLQRLRAGLMRARLVQEGLVAP